MKKTMLILLSLLVLLALTISIASAKEEDRALIVMDEAGRQFGAFDVEGNYRIVDAATMTVYTQSYTDHWTFHAYGDYPPGSVQYDVSKNKPDPFVMASTDQVCAGSWLDAVFGAGVSALACQGNGAIIFDKNILPTWQCWVDGRVADYFHVTFSSSNHISLICQFNTPLP